MRRACLTAMLCTLAGGGAAPQLTAQAPPPRLFRGTAVGLTIDRLLVDGGGITALSLRVTTLRPRRIGAEIALSTWPEGLGSGALALGGDAGPVYTVAASNSALLLKAGISGAIAVAAPGGGVAVWGGHAGAGLVTRLAPGLGVRIDGALRGYLTPGSPGGVLEVLSLGVGLTSLPAPH